MALPSLREDHHGVIPYRPTFLDIAGILGELLDKDTEVMLPAEREEHELALRVAMQEAFQKLDGYKAVIEALTVRIEARQAEIAKRKEYLEKLKLGVERDMKALDRLEEYAAEAIRRAGTDAKGKYRVLEGETSVFRVNRVPASCDVVDESKVPLAHKRVTVQMPAEVYAELLDKSEAMPPEWVKAVNVIAVDVMKQGLLAELKKPCPTCEGRGEQCCGYIDGDPNPEMVTCSQCGGTGKQRIPGAVLVSDRLRLCVE